MATITSSSLLFLSTLAAVLLWGVSFYNGTLENMNAVIAQGVFPDGRRLRSVYTGNGVLDARLTYLTAFYEVLSNDLSDGPRRLFVDLVVLLCCNGVWVFIESRRRGVRKFSLRHPIPFIILWNALGAALIQPLYLYGIIESEATARDPTVPLNEAIALFVTTIMTMLLFPVFLFGPSWLGWDTWTHHGFIAVFLGSPFLMVFVCLLCIGLQYPRHGLVASKKPRAPNEDRSWIVASFLFAAVISTIVHLSVVFSTLAAPGRDATLTRVFWPTPSKVGNPTETGSLQPRTYLILLEGYHLFSQFDWIVVSLACIFYVHLLLGKIDGRTVHWQRLAWLLVGSIVVGPGAVGSMALAVREYQLREKGLSKKI